MDYDDPYTIMAKTMKTVELHYPIIQFLIILIILIKHSPKGSRAYPENTSASWDIFHGKPLESVT